MSVHRFEITAGDTVEFLVLQNSGAALDLLSGGDNTAVTIIWMDGL